MANVFRKAHLRVHVRPVHVHLSAVPMDGGADILNRIFEDAMRRWIGDHQRRKTAAVLFRFCFQIGHVDVAVRVGRDDNDFEAGHHCAGRIGSMRRCRNQHDIALRVATRMVVGANRHQAGELALRARVGL
jgi:hypothetical protein